MTVQTAELRLLPDEGSGTFVPYASDVPGLADMGYVQEEWIASGVVDGHSYETVICVRRPRDNAQFSGTVIVEPLHVHGIAPVFMYTGPYILRSGHAWVEVTAQKTTLDMHVKASNLARYEGLHIDGPDSSDFDSDIHLENPVLMESFWSELERRNRAAVAILAQVGAALRGDRGPLAGLDVRHVVLVGHSQTGNVTTSFIGQAHDRDRREDGAPVYDGFFPSGFPLEPFHDVDVPIVQVMSEGDVAVPGFSFRAGFGDRRYRRDDSDTPGDRYRLYELAGVPHMGTRNAPYDDVSLWEATMSREAAAEHVTVGPQMNSLPHFELFSMCLDHLVQWVARGVEPPRADRLVIEPDGFVAQDEFGNSRGGVRCVQLDVPHSRYHANPVKPDGRPSILTVGSEEPFDAARMASLYGDRQTYVDRFEARLAELTEAGWVLPDDAGEMRRDLDRAVF